VAFTKTIVRAIMALGGWCLVLDKSKSSDYRMRNINADGSEAECAVMGRAAWLHTFR